MNEVKRYYRIGDFLSDFMEGMDAVERLSPFRTSFTFPVFDGDRYELIEKPNWREKKLEEEIADLERNREMTAKYYDNRLKPLKEELEGLKNKRKTKTG